MVIYHFPCLESNWCPFPFVPVENFRLQRNVWRSSHFFFAVVMSQTDFHVRFLYTHLGYQSHAFAAVFLLCFVLLSVNRTRFTTELAILSFVYRLLILCNLNQPVWPYISREFKMPWRRRPRKRRLKSEFAFFQFYRDYSNSFTLSNASELVLSRIPKFRKRKKI